MIGKELLSAVLGIPLSHIRYNDTTNLYEIFKEDLFNWSDGSYGRWSNLEVNIYELAHKCKEWASINSYALESSVHMQPKRSSVAGCQIHWRCETEDLPYFEAGSEPEAIFKACEWILDKDSK